MLDCPAHAEEVPMLMQLADTLPLMLEFPAHTEEEGPMLTQLANTLSLMLEFPAHAEEEGPIRIP